MIITPLCYFMLKIVKDQVLAIVFFLCYSILTIERELVFTLNFIEIAP